jgi:CubicO group peptidase (beta-lactamase class C family)
MRKQRLPIFRSTFPLLLVVMAFSCTGKTIEERAEKKINALMEESGSVGLSVAVVVDGEIVYTRAFGKSSLENDTRLESDDIFRIASISKSFTTTALLKLVDEGRLSIDADVSTLTGFTVRNPAYPDVPVTVKMLLSHSSSLNDSQGYFSLDVLNPATNSDYGKCYNDYMPGTKYQYCNLGFNTLGTIIEKVSGTRFDRYVRDVVILPLQLTASFNVDDLAGATFVSLYHPDTTGFAATGKTGFKLSEGVYDSRAAILDTAYIMGYSTPLFSPTGGMKISAPGLARYMIMHMNYGTDPSTGSRILSEESSAAMQTPVMETGEGSEYCLALARTSNLVKGEVLTGHTGSAYGLYSAMYFEPEKRFGFVMMTNGTTPDYANYVDGFAPVQRVVINILYDLFVN